MSDFDNINDAVLATYVDEYVRRAINEVRRYEDLNKQTIRISIEAAQSYHDAQFTVKHNIQVGDTYDNDGQYARHTSDNLVRGAHLCVMRLVTDLQTPPHKYSAMLPAPEPEQLTSVASDPLHHVGEFNDLTVNQEVEDADTVEFNTINDCEEEQVSSETGSSEAADTGDETNNEKGW